MFDQLKAAVTISEMARMCSLSRSPVLPVDRHGLSLARLLGVHSPSIFRRRSAKVCLEVRRRNCGVDGRPVLFYARQHSLTSRPTPKAKAGRQAEAPHPR
jgi:hypothetical protein